MARRTDAIIGIIGSALFGLIFWAMLAWAGWWIVGVIDGVALWRVFFFTGYTGYIMGLCNRPTTRNEKEATP